MFGGGGGGYAYPPTQSGVVDPYAAGDGRALAPAGTIQFPHGVDAYGTGSAFIGAPAAGRYRWPSTAVLNPNTGNFHQPQWMIAGIDFPVGIDRSKYPNNSALTPAATGSLPAGVTRSGNTIKVTGNNVLFDGWDFTGFVMSFTSGISNLTITNSNWVGIPNTNMFFCQDAAGLVAQITNFTFKYNNVDQMCGVTTAVGGPYLAGATSIQVADASRLQVQDLLVDYTNGPAMGNTTGVRVSSFNPGTGVVNLATPLSGTVTAGDLIFYLCIPPSGFGGTFFEYTEVGNQIWQYNWIRQTFQLGGVPLPLSTTTYDIRYNLLENCPIAPKPGSLAGSNPWHGDYNQMYNNSSNAPSGPKNCNSVNLSYNTAIFTDPNLTGMPSQGWSIFSAGGNNATCQQVTINNNVNIIPYPQLNSYGLFELSANRTGGAYIAAVTCQNNYQDNTGVWFLNTSDGNGTGWSNFNVTNTGGPYSCAAVLGGNISMVDGKTQAVPTGQH